MSLNTVIAFALLLKKITRKSSIGKNFRTKKRTDPHSVSSYSSASSCDEDEYPVTIEEEEEEEVNVKHKSTSSILTASIKSITPSHQKIKDALNTPLENVQTFDVSDIKQVNQPSYDVIIRDFAYPVDSPLHHGNPVTLLNQSSAVSLSSPEFNGRDARALFDFIPETAYEVGFKAGQIIWVQYRECPGWLIADVSDETGLVPECYVEFI